MAKTKLFWERYYPYILAIIFVVIAVVISNLEFIKCIKATDGNYLVDKITNKMFADTVLGNILTIGGILFGFLLTVLAIVLQMDSPNIKELKKVGRFHELVSYNKQAVLAILIMMIFTVVLLISNNCIDSYFYIVFKYIWGAVSVLSMLLTYRFLDIFYVFANNT